MLRIGRAVAWLRLGSCTDQVINAAAAVPANAIKPSPASSRNRRTRPSRIAAGRWPARGITRSIAGIRQEPLRLIQNFDQPVQSLGRRFAVRYQCEANIASAGIEAVGLLPRQITSRNHPYAGLPIEFHRRLLVAAMRRHVEPDAESAIGTAITEAVAEDLVGEIEFDSVKPAVFLDMH